MLVKFIKRTFLTATVLMLILISTGLYGKIGFIVSTAIVMGFIIKKIHNKLNDMQKNQIMRKYSIYPKEANTHSNLKFNNRIFDDRIDHYEHIDGQGRFNPIPDSPFYNPYYDN